MISLDNLTPEDLLFLTNALTISLSKNKNADELNVIGNILVSAGSLMLVLAAQEQLLSSLKDKNSPPPSTPESKNTNNKI